ncbi:MAG TPA: signal peptidase II [Vulgatibacter sp.]|nr:signal peptidase II [Vulgatibacter sp.]
MSKRNLALASGLFAVTAALDWSTKVLSEERLGDGSVVTVVQGWAWLKLAYNRGVAFSFLEGVPHWLLGAGAIVLLGVVVWSLRPLARSAVGAAALGMVVAGGLCNAIDRLHDGQVTDMIAVWKWPVFNVADSAITVGVAMLLLASRREKAPATAQPSAEMGLRRSDEDPPAIGP